LHAARQGNPRVLLLAFGKIPTADDLSQRLIQWLIQKFIQQVLDKSMKRFREE